MNGKNGRIRSALEALVLAGLVGIGVAYVAGRCGHGQSANCIFGGVSDLWAGALDTGVMLVAGALLAAMLAKVDGLLGINCHAPCRRRKGTGE
jgi:hypothetical protein